MMHSSSSCRPVLLLSSAEDSVPEAPSVPLEVSSQRACLLRFRALLQNLEHEYSVLLHNRGEPLPEEEIDPPNGETLCEEWDAAVPMDIDPNHAAHCPVSEGKPLPEIGYDDSSPRTRDTKPRPSQDSNIGLVVDRLPSATSAFTLFGKNSTLFEKSSNAEEVGTSRVYDSLKSVKVFPSWWNPDQDVLSQMVLERTATQDPAANKPKPCCVFSPVAFPKLHWDFLGFGLILYDSWATPFQMIFSSDNLELTWMRHIGHAITAFFSFDIILNFNTGVVVKHGISFERQEMVRQYIQSWFWLDLVATIPYDEIYQGASLTGLLRFVKMLKFLKTLRLLRLMNTLKSLRKTESNYFQAVHELKRFAHTLGILLVLFLNMHLFCCMWLALSDSVHADTFSKAMHIYCDTYETIFFAFFSGERLHAQTTSKKLLEMVIFGEHFMMICLFSAYATFQAWVLHGDTAKSRRLRDQVQQYMSRHGLPIGTQIQVLTGLEESRSARALQKDFIALTSSDLPEELRQKIAFELWEDNLMKLGLFVRISQWDEDFCHSMSLLCREEVFATDVVVFREQDMSIAAYCIVTGELKVSCALIDGDIPNFKEGTWVGEGALVNPSFRRGLHVVSLRLSSVMVVISAEFQELLKESNLWHRFQEFLVTEVLHGGLCGRCGSIGDHFFDSCPSQYVQWLSGFAAVKQASCPCWPSANGADSDIDQVNIRELVGFLENFEALNLLPALKELKVYSLSQLENLDIDCLHALFLETDPECKLTKNNLAEYIKKYRDDLVNTLQGEIATDNNQHFLFLSHYKVEAGTEAALMRSELETIIDQVLTDGQMFRVPIFLDSEDLKTLKELEEHVKKSLNIVLLLTRGVLSRPWCLVELVTAARCGVPVVPLKVVKPGVDFTFPTESFYEDLLAGKFLDEAAKQLLSSCDIEIDEVEQALRRVFQNIAGVYSPHRTAQVRLAELQELLRNCRVKKIPLAKSRSTLSMCQTGSQRSRPVIKSVFSDL